MDNNTEKNKSQDQEKSLKPDAETLHTTDPEKNMEGPVSSSTRKMGQPFDTDETKEEADNRRDGHM